MYMRKMIVSAVALTLLSLYAAAADLGTFSRGAGSMPFDEYKPLAGRGISLCYYIPTKGNVRTMPVLIVFHGAQRTACDPRDNWMDLAEKDGFVVLAPEFPKDGFDENAYQFGNVYADRSMTRLNPEELWVYSIVEPIFDYFKSQTGNRARTYSIDGHSAGGQFVHRFLIAKPDARVDMAVASNPGTWTWISSDGTVNGSEDKFTWPYSVYGTPFNDRRHIEAYFSRNLVVHLGDADTATSGKYVPTDKAALTEGSCRYERGQNYFAQMRDFAANNGFRFNWEMVVVRGVGHRGKGMIYAISRRDENNVRTYSVDETRSTGAYQIIFGK